MWILGFIFLCILVLIFIGFVAAIAFSMKDIARYIRIRRM